MGHGVAEKLILAHLVAGKPEPGAEIGLRIDQTLTQDATGTLVMLELEAMGLERVKASLCVQYVDHNLLQTDGLNADDHLFLESACRKFGVWYSPPGNGVSHPIHMQRFGKPGQALLGSDSHTCAAGSIGMLAIGAGGIDVAMAMAGEPFSLAMPRIWGVRLHGRLPEWVSAKDVILEMLRRHGVKGGLGQIIEYHGDGLAHLSAWDRHVIANMGAELGATTSVFPSDEQTRAFLRAEEREGDWLPLSADADARYDLEEEIDLSSLEPLIALPSSPGRVVAVREVAGQDIYQSYIGSSANPGYRDFAIAALMVRGRRVPPHVSFDVNPTSRQLLEDLVHEGLLVELIRAGARLHQAGCNGCIGMGQAPATGRNSLRTVPRNFPGRSGTEADRVFLCSPETAAASALTGVITDPRTLGMPYPVVQPPRRGRAGLDGIQPPPPLEQARSIQLVKGPNIERLPELDELPGSLEIAVLLKLGDDVSTDEILPAGAKVLPYRSNIPRIAEFAFQSVDPGYVRRALNLGAQGGHAIIAAENYGQGSSREHAALAPRYLGLRLVMAKSFARIHQQNLVNFGVLPLLFEDPADFDRIQEGERLVLHDLRRSIRDGNALRVEQAGARRAFQVRHRLARRDVDILLAGGLTNWIRLRGSGRVGDSTSKTG